MARPNRPLRARPVHAGPSNPSAGVTDELRGGCAVLLAIVLVVGGSMVLSLWRTLDPPTSPQARRLEDRLLDLPIGAPTALGLSLRQEHSTAGEAASGFMADSPNDPMVTRTYGYDRDPMEVCAGLVGELEGAGWVVEERGACEAVGSSVFGQLRWTCSTLPARAEIRVRTVPPGHAGTVVLVLSTPYPDDSGGLAGTVVPSASC